MNTCDVIVIGAGAAGLSAAAILRDAGCHVTLLEARKRIGGRIHTIHDPASAEPAELGAEFVHGNPAIIEALPGVGTTELEGEQLCYENGRFSECEDVVETISSLLRNSTREQSFDDLLAASGLAPAQCRRARAYVEGFNAADSSRISVEALLAQEESEGGRVARIAGGYDTVPATLNSGLDIRLNSAVDSVRWSRHSVSVQAGPQSISARRAIITLPLGVLQAGAVRFEPHPAGIFNAVSRLDAGHAIRITFRFDQHVWARHPILATAGFLQALAEPFPAWWRRGQLLTAWAGGRQAMPLFKLNRDQLVETALATLSRFSEVPVETLRNDLAAVHYHDWRADPFSLCAYSYIPAGALDAVSTLAEPVDGTLFFAGEACAGSYSWGTVHGAMESGQRAAHAILAQL